MSRKQPIVAWLVYTLEQEIESRIFEDRQEAEDCAAEVGERLGVNQWDILPLRSGKPESVNVWSDQ